MTMDGRAQRYLRRPRAPGGRDEFESSLAGEDTLRAGDGGDDEKPHHRRHRPPHFAERMESMRSLLRYAPADESWVLRTSVILRPHVRRIAEDVFGQLLASQETARYFSGAQGVVDADQVAMQVAALTQWLGSVIDSPLDGETAEFVASVGHAHVRPRTPGNGPIKGRYLLAATSAIQSSVIKIMGDAIADPRDAAASADAWCKRLMIHLDLLFAVYASTQASGRWY